MRAHKFMSSLSSVLLPSCYYFMIQNVFFFEFYINEKNELTTGRRSGSQFIIEMTVQFTIQRLTICIECEQGKRSNNGEETAKLKFQNYVVKF